MISIKWRLNYPKIFILEQFFGITNFIWPSIYCYHGTVSFNVISGPKESRKFGGRRGSYNDDDDRGSTIVVAAQAQYLLSRPHDDPIKMRKRVKSSLWSTGGCPLYQKRTHHPQTPLLFRLSIYFASNLFYYIVVLKQPTTRYSTYILLLLSLPRF